MRRHATRDMGSYPVGQNTVCHAPQGRMPIAWGRMLTKLISLQIYICTIKTYRFNLKIEAAINTATNIMARGRHMDIISTGQWAVMQMPRLPAIRPEREPPETNVPPPCQWRGYIAHLGNKSQGTNSFRVLSLICTT